MIEGPPTATRTGTLDIVLPDWGHLDAVRASPLPFALWTVGDQCLLYHWLDHAVNLGRESIRLFTADRPAEIRSAMQAATLWPLDWEVLPITGAQAAPADALLALGLPEEGRLKSVPSDGWELLDYLATLEKRWLASFHHDPIGELLTVGTRCRIHPETKITQPCFIGDYVLIAPGCEIGPNAVIGSGSVLSGDNRVVDSHLAAHSFLGPHTQLDNALLDGGVIYDRRNRVRLDRLEAHLTHNLEEEIRTKPTARERLIALGMMLKFGSRCSYEGTFETHNGMVLRGRPDGDLHQRLSWLPQVLRGKMRLMGVLPRTAQQLAEIDAEQRALIANAPVGVFSYADCQGCHQSSDFEEMLHAAYQAALPPGQLDPIIHTYLRELTKSDFAPTQE